MKKKEKKMCKVQNKKDYKPKVKAKAKVKAKPFPEKTIKTLR